MHRLLSLLRRMERLLRPGLYAYFIRIIMDNYAGNDPFKLIDYIVCLLKRLPLGSLDTLAIALFGTLFPAIEDILEIHLPGDLLFCLRWRFGNI